MPYRLLKTPSGNEYLLSPSDMSLVEQAIITTGLQPVSFDKQIAVTSQDCYDWLIEQEWEEMLKTTDLQIAYDTFRESQPPGKGIYRKEWEKKYKREWLKQNQFLLGLLKETKKLQYVPLHSDPHLQRWFDGIAAHSEFRWKCRRMEQVLENIREKNMECFKDVMCVLLSYEQVDVLNHCFNYSQVPTHKIPLSGFLKDVGHLTWQKKNGAELLPLFLVIDATWNGDQVIYDTTVFGKFWHVKRSEVDNEMMRMGEPENGSYPGSTTQALLQKIDSKTFGNLVTWKPLTEHAKAIDEVFGGIQGVHDCLTSDMQERNMRDADGIFRFVKKTNTCQFIPRSNIVCRQVRNGRYDVSVV